MYHIGRRVIIKAPGSGYHNVVGHVTEANYLQRGGKRKACYIVEYDKAVKTLCLDQSSYALLTLRVTPAVSGVSRVKWRCRTSTPMVRLTILMLSAGTAPTLGMQTIM